MNQLIDTNIMCELVHPEAKRNVSEWLSTQKTFTCVIVLEEVHRLELETLQACQKLADTVLEAALRMSKRNR